MSVAAQRILAGEVQLRLSAAQTRGKQLKLVLAMAGREEGLAQGAAHLKPGLCVCTRS